MPYVTVETEVWMDEPECAGDCESARDWLELKERIAEALTFLDAGMPDEAAFILRGEDHLRRFARADAVAATYQQWKKGRLPGFAPPLAPEERP